MSDHDLHENGPSKKSPGEMAFDLIMKEVRLIDSQVKEITHKIGVESRSTLVLLARVIDVDYVLMGHRYAHGWKKAIALCHDVSSLNFGVPLGCMPPNSTAHLFDLMNNITIGASLEHLAGCIAEDLMYVKSISPDAVILEVRDGSGYEGAERRQGSEWFRSIIQPQLESIDQDIESLLYTIQRYISYSDAGFISYTKTNETIEELFGDWADCTMVAMVGVDSFTPDEKIGGIRFDVYCRAVRYAIASTRKHLAFCAAAEQRRPIAPFNAFTTLRDLDRLIDDMSDYLGCNAIDARKIVEVLTKNPADATLISPPPYIRIGSNAVIGSVCGALVNPLVHMLEALKRKYPAEWDSAVESREDIFRTQISNELRRFGVLTLDGPRKVSTPRGRTDIDVVSLDANTGTLALFQLKWMDPFGESLVARRSKKLNFEKSAIDWVEKMYSWIDESDLKTTARSLGFSKKQTEAVGDVRVFVLGRYFSLFSRSTPQTTEPHPAAWGTWTMFQQTLRDFSRLSISGVSHHGVLDWAWRELKSRQLTMISENRSAASQTIATGTLRVEIITK